MKVGILTYHRAVNCGAVLQAYALEKVICQLGHDCELIDYRNPFIEQIYAPTPVQSIRSIKMLLKVLLFNRIRKQRIKKFRSFLFQHCALSETILAEKDFTVLRGKYDVVISGSDQVWNLKLSDEDYEYFLEAFDQSVRKCSYAASISVVGNGWSGSQSDRITADLKKFDAISVRENTAKIYLDSIGLETTIDVVLDPTLLLSKEDWSKEMSKEKVPGIPEKYLLAYFISQNHENCLAARRVARQLGLKAVLINYSQKPAVGFRNLMTVAPDEFLHLIADAEYFVTDSFHGVAFSVIFRKDFIYRLNPTSPEKNDRIETLTQALGITDRNYDSMCLSQNWNRINNWDEITDKLSALRQHSMDYLIQKVLI